MNIEEAARHLDASTAEGACDARLLVTLSCYVYLGYDKDERVTEEGLAAALGQHLQEQMRIRADWDVAEMIDDIDVEEVTFDDSPGGDLS